MDELRILFDLALCGACTVLGLIVRGQRAEIAHLTGIVQAGSVAADGRHVVPGYRTPLRVLAPPVP